jgi:SAM-dependent methyltransferase
MDDPGKFFDPVAPVYDARINDDQAPDVAFYRELAHEAGGPVLELGVGTGRIYLELLADGIDIDGIDLSERMLEQLHENAQTRSLEPSVWSADMTGFDTDREYDLIYAPARVFSHLPSLADQRAALRNIHDTLSPDGRFALNTYVPRFETVVEDYGTPQEEQLEADGGSYRIVRTSQLVDEVEQLVRLHWEVYHENELLAERETPLALIPKRQFELLFEVAEFSDWQVYGGFDRDPLESADREMVWIVDK